jgi:Na+/proline symporter
MAIRIIPALIARMPTWLAPLMFLGILACQMSTVDTFANAAALALGHDLLGEHGHRNCRPCRMVSVAVLLSALVYAVFMDRLGDIYYISSGVLSASIAVPLLAWGWRRVTAGPVLAASAAGALSAIGFYWLEYKVWALKPPGALSWLAPSSGYNYLAGCVLTAAGVLVVSTLLWPRSRHAPIRATQASEPDRVPEVV